MLNKFSRKVFSLVLISLVLVSNISPAIAYAGYKDKEKDYKFVYIPLEGDKTWQYIDYETGKWTDAVTLNKKYKKKYKESLKLNRPIQPEQPKETKSILKKDIVNRLKKNAKTVDYIAFIIEYYGNTYSEETSSNLDLTDYKAVKKNNLKVMKFLEEQTGIKTNERYFEELITNTLHYIDDKMATQINNKNNPYKEELYKLRNLGIPNKGRGTFRTVVGHWLFYGGKISPNNFNFDECLYNRPYFSLLSARLTSKKNQKIEVLAIVPETREIGLAIINGEVLAFGIGNECDSILDIKDATLNDRKEVIREKFYISQKPWVSQWGFWKLGDSSDNLLGEDCFTLICEIEGDLYTADMYYYDGSFVIFDMNFCAPVIFVTSSF